MGLDSGYYKIGWEGNSLETEVHYLRVFKRKGKLYYQVDYSDPMEAEKFESQLGLSLSDDQEGRVKIIKRITQPITISNLTVQVSFEDEDKDKFKFTARNEHVLNNIFEKFPRIAKAFRME